METQEYRISSYSDIYAVGHKALADLFSGPVVVEEKIDGSQISFGKRDGQIFCRSKGVQIVIDAPNDMFRRGVEAILSLSDKLVEGLTYRGEYLMSEKHNALKYARIPDRHIIIFDIDRGNQDYMPYDEKKLFANQLGLEIVPLIYHGEIKSVEQLKELLPKTGVLGGDEPEGIVIKNYARFAPDKKILMGKYVRPEFKETNAENWKKTNPGSSDIISELIKSYKTEARWLKAVQHLRDNGSLEQSPRDIGNLMKEVEADTLKECESEIKDRLFKWAWHQIARGTRGGLPEWYKNYLLEQSLPK